MIPALSLFVIASSQATSVLATQLLLAPEAKVVKLLGPKRTERQLPFALFFPKGYREVRVDNFGDKMTYLRFWHQDLLTWQNALKKAGLSATGVKAKLLPGVDSPTAIKRNEVELAGVKGLPAASKPWKVSTRELAVVNVERARKLKPQIQAASGDARFRLIRSCYDWYTEILFTNR